MTDELDYDEYGWKAYDKGYEAGYKEGLEDAHKVECFKCKRLKNEDEFSMIIGLDFRSITCNECRGI